MRWPLRYQILLPFTLVLLAAIVTVSVLNAVVATRRSREQIEEQLRGIAATLAESNFPLTDAVLRQMRGLSGAEFVLVDAQRRPMATSGSLELGTDFSVQVADSWQELRLGPPVAIREAHYFAMALAVKSRGGQPPGLLYILYPERSWQEARKEAVMPPLIVGGVALAVTAGLGLLLAGRLTKPILELRSQVSRIAQADYQPMPLPPRDDELRDLATSINQLAEQLSQMDRAIRRSERLALVGQLAGGLAHHLRNHVTGALLAVQLHERSCGADQESLAVAVRQLSLLEQNLKQLLTVPQDARLAIAKTRLRIEDAIEDAVKLVAPSLRHRRIALRTASDPEHATAADQTAMNALAIDADPGQIRQLLVNLVLNGADAAGPGGWVKITAQGPVTYGTNHPTGESPSNGTSSPNVVLCVSDSGPGPAPAVADRLFEPFVTSKPEGVGLGLVVSRQIAAAHGGTISLFRKNSETCVEVQLPLAERLQDAAAN